MIKPTVERQWLDSDTEVIRTTSVPEQSGVEKRIVVEYWDSRRVTRFKSDFFDKDRPFNGEVLIGAPTGTPLVAILARIQLSYGRTVQIAHGSEESVLNNALRMSEVYRDDNFFSGISFTWQTLDKIHLFHSVNGDKDRFKGLIALGEVVEHPSTWTPFPYEYSVQRNGSELEFNRVWKPTSSRWSVRMGEGLTTDVVADQIKGSDWINTKKVLPVSLKTDKD